MLSIVLAVLFALVIGGSLGLLGGGGSILSVPVLIYVMEIPDKNAIAMSLLIVSITSFVAALQQARHGNVAFRPAILFAGSASVGALAGGRLAGVLPSAALLLIFGIVMLIAAVAMWRKSGAEAASEVPHPKGPRHGGWIRIVPLAAGVGFLTGLVGAGGGFLIVPVLTLFLGLPMRLAIGTSLAVISINTMAGFIGYMGHVSIDLKLTMIMAFAAIVGSVGGAALGKKTSPATLRRGFAAFTFGMALFVLYKESTKSPQVTALLNGTTTAWVGGITAGIVLSALVLAGISSLRQAKEVKTTAVNELAEWFYEI